jgi:hypothetical protein
VWFDRYLKPPARFNPPRQAPIGQEVS